MKKTVSGSIILIISIATFLSYTHVQRSDISNIKLEINKLLHAKKFSKLNEILHTYQLASETDNCSEKNLHNAYWAFCRDSEGYETLLNNWTESFPDHYQPYLARACYYYEMGWAARGFDYARNTSREQFDSMNSYFAKAEQDIEQVHKHFNKTVIGYELLMSMRNAQGRQRESDAAKNKALTISPASYAVRVGYLYTIRPRWGGSYEQMNTFIQESLTLVSQNPKLKLLQGEILIEKGYSLLVKKEYEKADPLFTQALLFGENSDVYYKRGMNRMYMEQYEESLHDLNRALELNPEASSFYYRRSLTHSYLEQYDKAMTDIQKSLAIKPNYKKAKYQKGWILVKNGYQLQEEGDYITAIYEFNRAEALCPEYAYLYYQRGKAYTKTNQLDLAFADLKKSIELAPEEFNYHYIFAWVCGQTNRWEQAVEQWQKYIRRVPDDSQAQVELGGAHFMLGQRDKAMEYAQIALEMGNENAEGAYNYFAGEK